MVVRIPDSHRAAFLRELEQAAAAKIGTARGEMLSDVTVAHLASRRHAGSAQDARPVPPASPATALSGMDKAIAHLASRRQAKTAPAVRNAPPAARAAQQTGMGKAAAYLAAREKQRRHPGNSK
jgi:hypothetical protein